MKPMSKNLKFNFSATKTTNLDNSGGDKGPSGELHERALRDGGEDTYRQWASIYDDDLRSVDYVGPRNLATYAIEELTHGKWVFCVSLFMFFVGFYFSEFRGVHMIFMIRIFYIIFV